MADPDEKQWRDALGTQPARDFQLRVFYSAPAMVKKEPVNGHRMWSKYDPTKFSDAEYELMPGMWDHEHCAICWEKIGEGDAYWENSQKRILCPTCHAKFERTR